MTAATTLDGPVQQRVACHVLHAMALLAAHTGTGRPPSLQALADTVGLSRTALLTEFRASVGTSPYAWLRDQRLQDAREALESTSLSITEIAKACGYAHVSTFSHAYRHRFGQSPRQWRQRRGWPAPSHCALFGQSFNPGVTT